MNLPSPPTDAEILALRPAKNVVDPWRTYAAFVEDEWSAQGKLEPVATLFLTNRECPLRCAMCDLWRNTTDQTVPVGAIPAQIDEALARLPPARHIKLYNSGNFFDRRAIPVEDYPAIAQRVRGFETVIVESHPRFGGDDCRRFRDLLAPEQQLEIAMGLETIHSDALALLNKRMTATDFAEAALQLRADGIELRTFVLLRPPTLSEQEGVEWAVRSVAFAFDVGVRVAAIIPTRGGNGWMEKWQAAGCFHPPRLESLESAMDQALAMGRGRVFADLWDLERFSGCERCFSARRNRLDRINRTQMAEPRVFCPSCCGELPSVEG